MFGKRSAPLQVKMLIIVLGAIFMVSIAYLAWGKSAGAEAVSLSCVVEGIIELIN